MHGLGGTKRPKSSVTMQKDATFGKTLRFRFHSRKQSSRWLANKFCGANKLLMLKRAMVVWIVKQSQSDFVSLAAVYSSFKPSPYYFSS